MVDAVEGALSRIENQARIDRHSFVIFYSLEGNLPYFFPERLYELPPSNNSPLIR